MDDKITFRKQWADAVRILPDEIRLEVYDAIMSYAFSGDGNVTLSPAAMVAFAFIKNDIDNDRQRKKDISEKRRMSGSKGGAPKNNKNARKKSSVPSQTVENNVTAVYDVKMQEKPPEEPVTVEEVEAEEVETEEKVRTVNVSSPSLFDDAELLQPKPKPKPKPKSAPPGKHRYAENVLMTDEEYRKLADKYGDNGAQWMITKLDNYKAARGMTYKSDYRAILNWVIKEYEKELLQNRNYGTNENWRPSAKEQRDAEFAQYITEKLSGD